MSIPFGVIANWWATCPPILDNEVVGHSSSKGGQRRFDLVVREGQLHCLRPRGVVLLPQAARSNLRSLGVMHAGRGSRAIDLYPVLDDGVFSPTSSGGLNAVTWWIIKRHGLLGPERSDRQVM